MALDADHTTDNGLSVADLRAAYSEVLQAPDSRLASLLRRAERLVADLAPKPSGLSTEDEERYADAAIDTELAVFEFLYESGGAVQTEAVDQLRTTYRDQREVQEIVRQSMGVYYVGPREVNPNPPRAKTRLKNVSEEPLW